MKTGSRRSRSHDGERRADVGLRWKTQIGRRRAPRRANDLVPLSRLPDVVYDSEPLENDSIPNHRGCSRRFKQRIAEDNVR